VALALALFVRSAAAMGRAVAVSADSDALYLAGLYRDLFVDRVSLKTWTLQPAPSFFPDLPLFALLRAVTGHPSAALYAYAVTELSLGVLFVVAIARLLEVPGAWQTWTAALVSMSALAYFNSFGDFFHILFAPSCHASCAWVSLGCALLVARQVKADRLAPVAALAVLLLTALTAGSDRLHALYAAGLLVAFAFTAAVVRRGRGVLAANAAAVVAGVVLGGRLEGVPVWLGMTVSSFDPVAEFSWARLLHVLGFLPPPENGPDVVVLDTGLLALALVLAFGASAVAAARPRPDRRATSGALALLASSFVASVACVFFGAAFSGAYTDPWRFRYLQGLLVWPYVVLPLAWLLWRRWGARLTLALAFAALVHATGRPAPSEKMKALLEGPTFYPAHTACVDDLARRHGARFAYGDYWSARRTTELSRAGLRVLSLTWGLGVYDWIVNRGWYEKARGASAFLVLMNRLDPGSARARLGSPALVERCPGEDVWVYRGAPRSPIVP